jgi:hypothetical protein
MNETFILQNQDKLFFGKGKDWVDGYDANSLFKTPYKDEAINQMVEISSKDYKQRVKVVSCELNEKGLPILDANIMPAPLPKAPKPPKAGEDLFSESVSVESEEEQEDEEVLEFSSEAVNDDGNSDHDNNQTALL